MTTRRKRAMKKLLLPLIAVCMMTAAMALGSSRPATAATAQR